MTEIEAYILEKGLEYKVFSEEIVITPCPFCGTDKGKFYINKNTGMFDCKICAHRGNLSQFKNKMGDLEVTGIQDIGKKYKPLLDSVIETRQKELETNRPAYEYLLSRGFSAEMIQFFRLGAEGDWIAIPHFQDQKLWNIKYRNFKSKEFRRVAGQPTILFNIDNVDTSKKTLIVVESETDAIATKQLGFNNVVGITGGAETFKPEWLPFFHKFKTVFLCLNSDEVGQKGARKFADKIGIDKCKNLILPTKDVNDYLKVSGNDRNTFEMEFAKAKKFDLKDISSMEDYINTMDGWLDGDSSMSGLDIGFPQLNTVLRGFKPQELIILSGDSGVGKTTFSFNIMVSLLKQGIPCLGFFLEGQIRYYIMRMMCIEAEIEFEKLRDDKEQWELLKKEFTQYPLFIYSGSQVEMNTKKMKELLPAAVKMHDIGFVLIDNLQKYVRGSDNMIYQRTGEAVSELKDLSIDLNVPICLIAHVTKRDSKDVNRHMTMHDLKDSSTIYQVADTVLFLQKDKYMNYEVTVEKNRTGEGGIGIPFIFNSKIAQFAEGEKEHVKKGSKLKKEGFN